MEIFDNDIIENYPHEEEAVESILEGEVKKGEVYSIAGEAQTSIETEFGTVSKNTMFEFDLEITEDGQEIDLMSLVSKIAGEEVDEDSYRLQVILKEVKTKTKSKPKVKPKA